MQDSDGQGCPFCRAEIKGTEQVVVDPFDPKSTMRVIGNSNRSSPTGGSSHSNIMDYDDEDAFEVRILFYYFDYFP